jgi:hypothetical protein
MYRSACAVTLFGLAMGLVLVRRRLSVVRTELRLLQVAVRARYPRRLSTRSTGRTDSSRSGNGDPGADSRIGAANTGGLLRVGASRSTGG